MELLELLLLAFLSALYPTLLAIVVIVLGRSNAGRFLAFFLAGAVLASVSIGMIAVFVLNASSLNTDRHALGAWVSLAAGVLAFLAGLALLRPARPKAPKPTDPEHPSLWKRTLDRDSAWMVFLLGVVLDLPGLWYLIALKKISLGNYSDSGKAILVIAYNVVMFALIEIPLVGFVLAPERTGTLVRSFNAWLGRNGRRFLAYVALALSVYFVARGLVALL
jgi:MFS family permease